MNTGSKTLAFFGIFVLILVFSNVVTCKADQPSVTVKFQVLNGNGGGEDFYSGDWIYYNITITNTGNSDINATFMVSIYNAAGSVVGNSRNYQFYLQQNQTVILYPNNTRFSPTDVDAYFVDTAGTYMINLTCNVPLAFYRYGNIGSYSWEIGHSHISLDVMPSYQKTLNEQTQQFYQQTQRYIQDYEAYVTQSRVEASKIQNLSIIAVVIASMSLVPSYYAIPEKRRNKKILLVSFAEVALMIIFVINLLI